VCFLQSNFVYAKTKMLPADKNNAVMRGELKNKPEKKAH